MSRHSYISRSGSDVQLKYSSFKAGYAPHSRRHRPGPRPTPAQCTRGSCTCACTATLCCSNLLQLKIWLRRTTTLQERLLASTHIGYPAPSSINLITRIGRVDPVGVAAFKVTCGYTGWSMFFSAAASSSPRGIVDQDIGSALSAVWMHSTAKHRYLVTGSEVM